MGRVATFQPMRQAKHKKGAKFMRNETSEEKKERIFNFYKKDLEKLGAEKKEIRFICIEYICRFPKINPYEMAAACANDNFKIIYDDSGISTSENRRKERKAKKFIAYI